LSKIDLSANVTNHGGKVMRKDIDKHVKETLGKRHECYVLITCDSPKADGSMQVEMTYQGDAAIAAYLLEGAQSFMDEQAVDVIASPNKKVYPHPHRSSKK
jgi:hypothetical protein